MSSRVIVSVPRSLILHLPVKHTVGNWYMYVYKYLVLFVCIFYRHYTMVSVSIPILQLRVSLHQLQVLRSVLDSLSPSSGKEDEEEGRGRENGDKEGKEKGESATEERKVLVFQDDLRNGSLAIEEQAEEGTYVSTRRERVNSQLFPIAN